MPTFFAGQTDYIEKLNDVDAAAGAAQDDIDAHIADTTAAHAASAISNAPAGNITSTTLQGAVNELDSEKLSASATALPSSFVNASLNSITPAGGTLNVFGAVTLSGGTANSVAYLNASKEVTTSSDLFFDGSTFRIAGDIVSIGNGARFSIYRDNGINYLDWADGQDLYLSTQASSGGSGRSTKAVFGTDGSLMIGQTTNPNNYKLAVTGNVGVTGTATAASFVGPLTGNASTATTLATARNINGVSFNGSADITVTAAAGTLTGATLAAGVTASSLTSVGTLTALTTTGSVGIGGAAPATTVLRLSKQGTGGTIAFGQDIQTQVQSDVTNSYSSVRSVSSTAATAFTLSQFNHFSAVQGVIGAGSTVTNQMGFEAQSSLTGAANNFGFYSNLASGTGRWNFYAAGTAANYFAGATTFADTLTVSGTSTLGVTRVSGADGGSPPQFGVAGTTRGVRILTSSYGTAIEGVDNTLVGSYQPLNIVGSALGFYTTASNGVTIGTGLNLTQFAIAHTASAVNYFQVQGSGTGAPVFLTAHGSDTNIGAYLATKGTGSWRFATGGGDQFRIISVASAVNTLDLSGSATGNAVTAAAAGSDSNIDFAITPKGTGVLRFGTHSALAAETVTGYITIKDAAGNSRKLAVLS